MSCFKSLTHTDSNKISSYKLIVYNINGKIIFSSETFLYPSDAHQKLSGPKGARLDKDDAKKLITKRLAERKLPTIKITMYDEMSGEYGSKIIAIESSLSILRQYEISSVKDYVASLIANIDNANSEDNTYISLIHIIINDDEGKIVYDLVRDNEAGTTQWRSEIKNDWQAESNPLIYLTVPTSEAYPHPIDQTNSSLSNPQVYP